MRAYTKGFLVGLVVLVAVPAQSGLISRAGGTMYYDDVLDITWLQNANLGGTGMKWADSVAWADALVFGGFDDWRLPSISVGEGLPTGSTDITVDCSTATEMDCRDNELGYMYYHNLGGTLGGILIGSQGPFQNVEDLHWSGTESASLPGVALAFVFNGGFQIVASKDNPNVAAWAVRSGDVLAAAPEPGTWLLLGAGALGLVRARKRVRRAR